MSRGMKRQATAPSLIVLNNIKYAPVEGGKHIIPVQAKEVMQLFTNFADCNGWDVHDLLGNFRVPAGEKLACRVPARFPPGWSFPDDPYIAVKLKQGRTISEYSFLGDGSSERADPTYAASTKPVLPELDSEHSDGQPSTPRSKRPKNAPTCADFSYSPGSPAHGEGERACVFVRLHRAAALAASRHPKRDSQLKVRHICGRKQCLVLSHYRPGTTEENEEDEAYHVSNLGKSKYAYPPLQ